MLQQFVIFVFSCLLLPLIVFFFIVRLILYLTSLFWIYSLPPIIWLVTHLQKNIVLKKLTLFIFQYNNNYFFQL